MRPTVSCYTIEVEDNQKTTCGPPSPCPSSDPTGKAVSGVPQRIPWVGY